MVNVISYVEVLTIAMVRAMRDDDSSVVDSEVAFSDHRYDIVDGIVYSNQPLLETWQYNSLDPYQPVMVLDMRALVSVQAV